MTTSVRTVKTIHEGMKNKESFRAQDYGQGAETYDNTVTEGQIDLNSRLKTHRPATNSVMNASYLGDNNATIAPNQKPRYQTQPHGGNYPGNSLVAFSPANLPIGEGFQFQANPDELENGDFDNKFTGAAPDLGGGDPLDRLLNTPYIQTLNSTSVPGARSNRTNGDSTSNFREDVVSSCWDRGRDGAKTVVSSRPQNSVRMWQQGDGYVDQDNPELMRRLLERRSFRTANKQDGKGNGGVKGDSADQQIPWYERGLYNRYYERDVDEALGGFEFDFKQRGYGEDARRELICRLDRPDCSTKNYPFPGGYDQVTNKPDWIQRDIRKK
jgi:hypothetical protein